MKISNFKFQILKFIIVIFLLSIIHNLSSDFIYAQNVLPFLVAPARQEITVSPGESTAINVRFFNLSESPISGFVKVADFIVDNIEGKPRIIEDATQASPRFSASSWFELPFDRMTIAANDKVAFQSRIAVPQSARPGGRYIAIYFEPISPNIPITGKSGTGVASRIAALVYIKVAGPVSENASISRFFTQSFYEYGPITVETEILNRSDYHIRPKGTITLTNMLGSVVSQDKIKEFNIFPDVARSYSNTIGQKWMLGRYKLTLTSNYGDKNQSLNKTIYFWIFPWKIAILIILTLIILTLLINSFYKKILVKEESLEKKLEEEEKEIEELKEKLKKRE